MKGVILAGGQGTRLRPITKQINKHLVPILNKPMVQYPIDTLKDLGITDIMIVSGGEHIGGFADFFGDGSEYGVSLTYRVQKDAAGIAQALSLAKDFVGSDRVVVILGDNIFEYKELPAIPEVPEDWAAIVVKPVHDPHRFGVYAGKGMPIEEKPKFPKSNLAVTGLYVYPPDVFDVIVTLKPSARGELEITDVNNYYLERDRCLVHEFKGFWSDAGTPESLYRAIKFAAGQDGIDIGL